MSKRFSELEIRVIANSLIGKTFGEINYNKLKSFEYDKGTFGHIIENDGYDYNINSFSEPDFIDAGIELKVTPYKINKNGTLSAKERLVLNIINYMEEVNYDFYTSHFWYKNKKIEILWYLYEKNKEKNELKITNELLFEFPKEDLKIIEDDWNFIINKIRNGKAHELSEADTMYLGACTKGVNSNSLRKQPFSNIMAKQRAFCLKTSYMTQLVRKYIGHEYSNESFLNSLSMEKYVENITKKYQAKNGDKSLPYTLLNKNEISQTHTLSFQERRVENEHITVPRNVIAQSIARNNLFKNTRMGNVRQMAQEIRKENYKGQVKEERETI